MFITFYYSLGTIPTEIGRMTSLQELRIYENNLSGTLPTSIGALTDMTLMMVKVNNLTGNFTSSNEKMSILY